jgi:hypothetical protein
MAEKRYANTTWDNVKETFGGKASPDPLEGQREVPPGYYGLDLGTGGVSAPSDPNFVESNAPAPPAMLDYSKPEGTGYNAYPGAGMGDPAAQRPAYEGPGPESAGGGVAEGAASGAAAGGPWGAVIGAGVGLLRNVMAQKAATKAAKEKYLLDQKKWAQQQYANQQQNQIRAAGEMGQNEQSALARMISMLNATRR